MNFLRVLQKFTKPQTVYRLGRFLYMQARGDIANDMATNGELMVQRCVIDAVLRSAAEKLVCFDVGANVGDWSSALLANCQSRQYQPLELYVFEPVPSTASVLRKRLGDKEYIHYELVALSSTEGTDVMYVSGATAGTNSLHQGGEDFSARSVSINKITASQFCSLNKINAIHLLKSDTEGHDMEMVIGALPLLKEGRIAVLQLEYNHRWIFSRHYLKDVFDTIEGLPYHVGKICPDHIEVYDKWYPEHERFFESNYVLLREDTMAWFDVRDCKFDLHNTLAVRSSS